MESARRDSPEVRKALANPMRARIYESLTAADRPRDIDDLVAASGLHANTVRWHLKKLLETPPARLGLDRLARLGPRRRQAC